MELYPPIISFDDKTLNAIRLHLILLNEGSEAVHFKLVEIIEQKLANGDDVRIK